MDTTASDLSSWTGFEQRPKASGIRHDSSTKKGRSNSSPFVAVLRSSLMERSNFRPVPHRDFYGPQRTSSGSGQPDPNPTSASGVKPSFSSGGESPTLPARTRMAGASGPHTRVQPSILPYMPRGAAVTKAVPSRFSKSAGSDAARPIARNVEVEALEGAGEEDEAEFSGGENVSAYSGDSDSSMEWEEDGAEGSVDEEDTADQGSDDDELNFEATSIMELPLSAVNDKFISLNRKLVRLRNTGKRANSATTRARRLDAQLQAELYTTKGYRQLLRATQTELTEVQKDKAALEKKSKELREMKDVAERSVAALHQQVSAMAEGKAKDQQAWQGEREETGKERATLVQKLEAAERAQRWAETEKEAAVQAEIVRHATLTAEKEAVEMGKAEAERQLREVRSAKEEGDRKMAMMREAHDFERTSYLDQIRKLREQLKVKVEGRT